MTRGLKEGEPNGRDVYPDIIDHPHWQSPVRPHMSLYDRAAQFSSFDALAGYSDMVREEQRRTDQKIEPGETELEILNRKMAWIGRLIAEGQHPAVSITYFEPDPLKEGGSYRTITESVKKIDTAGRRIVLMRKEGYSGRNAAIDMADILEIRGKMFDESDDRMEE